MLKPLVRIPNPRTGEEVETHVLDILNPPGMFINGVEQRSPQVSKAYQVPKLSGRLLPEFVARRSIKDMFSKRTTLSSNASPESVLASKPTDHESSSSQEVTDIVAAIPCGKAEDVPTRVPADRYALHSCTDPSCLGGLASSHANASTDNSVAKRPMSVVPPPVSSEGAPINKRRKFSSLLASPGAKATGQHKHQSKLSGFFMPQPEVRDSRNVGKVLLDEDKDKCPDMSGGEEERDNDMDKQKFENAGLSEIGDSEASGEQEGMQPLILKRLLYSILIHLSSVRLIP